MMITNWTFFNTENKEGKVRPNFTKSQTKINYFYDFYIPLIV